MSSQSSLGTVSGMEILIPSKNTSVSDIQHDIQSLDIIPDLFGILYELESGSILARDFEKHAGSIRLKIAKFRSLVFQIPGIDESNSTRVDQISHLKALNSRKLKSLLEICNHIHALFDKLNTG